MKKMCKQQANLYLYVRGLLKFTGKPFHRSYVQRPKLTDREMHATLSVSTEQLVQREIEQLWKLAEKMAASQ